MPTPDTTGVLLQAKIVQATIGNPTVIQAVVGNSSVRTAIIAQQGPHGAAGATGAAGAAGATGAAGAAGPVGPRGLPATSFIYTQNTPLNTWVVMHNLNHLPSVIIVDNSNQVVEGDIIYNNTNTLTLKFSIPFSGVAYLS